jgi:hypothetical protein
MAAENNKSNSTKDLEATLSNLVPGIEIADEIVVELEEDDKGNFDEDLVKKYPSSNKKLSLHVSNFGINSDENNPEKNKNGQTLHISPHGLEFISNAKDYEAGALIKIQVRIPDYWARKQKFVEYGRIDNPTEFRVLAKVLKTEDIGKRGKKKLVLAQTLVIDSVDEQVLKTFLQEG